MAGNRTESKQKAETGTIRERRYRCALCPPEVEHWMLPVVHNGHRLPPYAFEGKFLCDEHLHTENARYKLIGSALEQEVKRREALYQKLGY